MNGGNAGPVSEPLVKKRADSRDTMLGQGSTCSVLGPMGRGRAVVAMDTAVTQSSCCWTITIKSHTQSPEISVKGPEG